MYNDLKFVFAPTINTDIDLQTKRDEDTKKYNL